MLLTKYINELENNKPLQEYPRPQLVRDSYINLNGLWDFEISKTTKLPTNYSLNILVPYCVESVLSGINKSIEDDDYLYYRKSIKFDKKFIKDKVLLHIDAVDQLAKVYVNNHSAGESYNGYLPLVIDIKPYLKDEENEIVIQVKDELNLDYPYGKQKKNRGGMWYTPVSGIWQTVWIESVSDDYIENLTITPNIDNNSVTIVVKTTAENVSLKVLDGEEVIYKHKDSNHVFDIKLDNVKLWSPDNPFLYNIEISTKHDEIKSYFAMRKFSVDDKHILLNNKPIFINGLLDQGYFPDGIYTPASYEGYKDDVLRMKELGFNCLRKHIKVEPMMFYYYCDLYGMIVFQDMVNNGPYSFMIDTAFPTIGLAKVANVFKNTTDSRKRIFKESCMDTLNYLYNVPSIGYITIFNEGWGQHDSDDYYNLVKSFDNTRIIDSTSGWFKGKLSDVESLHVYFKKIKLKPCDKPIIVSEFGGYAYKVENHIFNEKKDYGYKKFNDIDEFNKALYNLYQNDVINNIKNGLAGCIYTQVSDVEDEINGLLTYDRKVCKVNKDTMLDIAKQIKKEFYND